MKKFVTWLLLTAMVLAMVPMAISASAEEPATKTIYFAPCDNWKEANARFAVYTWVLGAEGTWTDMTYDVANDVYAAEVSADVNMAIFGRMNPSTTANNWDNGTLWGKTADLSIDGNLFTMGPGWNATGTWSTYSPIIPASTLYLKPSSNWQEADARFAAYFFNNATGKYTWVDLNKDEVSGYYKVDVPEGYPNVIFCRMNPSVTDNNWEANTKWNQTGDLIVKAENLYTIPDDVWNGSGSDCWSTFSAIYDGKRSLSLEGEVFINQYAMFRGYENLGVDYIKENGGLLVWNADEVGTLTEDTAVYNEANAKAGLLYQQESDRYAQRTDGIIARQYADALYLRIYLKLADGSYVYGPLEDFSVREYCKAQIENTESKSRDVCIQLLHYGAAAQTYFDYKLDDLATNLGDVEMPASATLPENWYTPTPAAIANVPAASDKITHKGKTLSLDTAININYYFTAAAGTMELLVWRDGETELNCSIVDGELVTNATVVDMVSEPITGGIKFGAQSGPIDAQDYDAPIYVCAHLVDENGEHHFSEVIAFSVEDYAADRLENSQNENLKAVLTQMVLYGMAAEERFANA